MNCLIEFKKISKKYENKIVLNELDLNIYSGEVLGITGENGSGKSTILKILSNIVSPDEGKVIYHEVVKTEIVLEGSRNFYWNLTGYENLKYFSTVFNIKDKNKKIQNVIDIMELESFITELSGTYSRGMQQKLSIALSLLSTPNILLLDEPTNGLDESSVTNLVNVLQKLNTDLNMTLILVSHDKQFLNKIINREFSLPKKKINEIEVVNDFVGSQI